MEVSETSNCSRCNASDFVMIYQVPTGIIVLLSALYGSISVIAVVGNFMVIWIVASSKAMQNVTNCFICNLALADIVIGFFAIPFEFQAALLQRWNLPEFMCAFCPFIHVLSVNVSVFTLTAIAVDRHRAILYPLSPRISKAKAKIVISCIWIVSSLLAAPMAVALGVGIVEEAPGQLKPFCYNIHLKDTIMLAYRLILVILQYLIPLSVITWAYARIARALWGSKAPGNAQDTRDANLLKNKEKVIKMLVIVVALFGVCWLPLQVYNILQDIFPQINEYKYINIIWFCFDWLAMSNSCYNPFIYNYYNEKFRREFQFRLHICGHRVHTSLSKDKRDADKFTKSLRMSRYYNTRLNSSQIRNCSFNHNIFLLCSLICLDGLSLCSRCSSTAEHSYFLHEVIIFHEERPSGTPGKKAQLGKGFLDEEISQQFFTERDFTKNFNLVTVYGVDEHLHRGKSSWSVAKEKRKAVSLSIEWGFEET